MQDCLTQAPEDIRFLLQELKEAKNELAKHVHTYVSCRSENCNNPIRWSKSVRGLCNSCVDDLLDKCDGYANLLEDEIADLKFNEKGSSPNREQG